ncbi:hypothetical protein [Burkholderia multivorans]|uniref:hypothetical protein n=1 Tax=Burkholderia multivorans TaxID=87883 RepID=UPI000D013EEB|nr:hypothetical protein [Burkholderia multivorans]MBU9280826.1 hypothetical protein [Burkholderia multivorans]PRH44381.1 hypothetical protein C6V05_31075 [Burkholderia multivorans]
MYNQYHLAKQYAEGVHSALMAGYTDSIDGRNINAATRRFDVAIYDEHSLVRELGKRYWKLEDILADC